MEAAACPFRISTFDTSYMLDCDIECLYLQYTVQPNVPAHWYLSVGGNTVVCRGASAACPTEHLVLDPIPLEAIISGQPLKALIGQLWNFCVPVDVFDVALRIVPRAN